MSNKDGVFQAEVTSPISVSLSWNGLSAAKYLLEISIGGSEFSPLAELPGDTTSYENFPAIPERTIQYRLTAINNSVSDQPLLVEVQTPAQVANPLTVTLTPDLTVPDLSSVDFSSFDPSTIDPSNPGTLPFAPTLVSESAEIGPEGGALSVVSSTGVKYTYTVPPGALDEPITFTISPIASMEGSPLTGAFLGAALIQPIGLELNEPAVLTIEPAPGAAAASDEVLATYDLLPDGSEFSFTGSFTQANLAALSSPMKLAEPDKPDDTWVMQPWDIPQKKTGPAGTGVTTRGSIKKQAQSHPPTDKDSQTAQNNAALDDDLAPIYPTEYLDFTQRSLGLSGWKDTLSLMSDMEYKYQTAKDKKASLAFMDRAIENLIDRIDRNFLLNMNNCVSKDDFEAYMVAWTIKTPKTAFGKIISTRYQSKHGLKNADDVIKKAANCNLRLVIKSEVTVKGGGGMEIILQIESTVPLKIHYDTTKGSVYYSGTGPINYLQNQINMDPCHGNYKSTGKNTFVVSKLYPIFAPSSATLTGFSMGRYSTPGSFNQIRVKCPLITVNSLIPKGQDMWGGFYTLTKFEDLAITWQVTGAPIGGDVATLSTNASRPIGDGSVSENSTFTLKVNQ